MKNDRAFLVVCAVLLVILFFCTPAETVENAKTVSSVEIILLQKCLDNQRAHELDSEKRFKRLDNQLAYIRKLMKEKK